MGFTCFISSKVTLYVCIHIWPKSFLKDTTKSKRYDIECPTVKVSRSNPGHEHNPSCAESPNCYSVEGYVEETIGCDFERNDRAYSGGNVPVYKSIYLHIAVEALTSLSSERRMYTSRAVLTVLESCGEHVPLTA